MQSTDALCWCPTASTPRFEPLTTLNLQTLYASRNNSSSRLTAMAMFYADGWGRGSVSVIVQRLSPADKEVEDEAVYVGRNDGFDTSSSEDDEVRVLRGCLGVRPC